MAGLLDLIQNPEGQQGPGLLEKFLGSPVGRVASVPLDAYGLLHALRGGGSTAGYYGQAAQAQLGGHEARIVNQALQDHENDARLARVKLFGPQFAFLDEMQHPGTAGHLATPPTNVEASRGMSLLDRGGPSATPTAAPTSAAAPSAPAETGGGPSLAGMPLTGVNAFGMQFRSPDALAPVKINPATARKIGLKSGDVYSGRRVLVQEPNTPAAIVTKEANADVLDKNLTDLEQAANAVGPYSAWDVGREAAKKEHPILSQLGHRLLGMKDDSGGTSPAWTTLLNWGDINGTALMQMHVGARGSEGMMEHFVKDIVAASHQGSPQLMATIAMLRKYIQNIRGGMDGDDALKSAGYDGSVPQPVAQPGARTIGPAQQPTPQPTTPGEGVIDITTPEKLKAAWKAGYISREEAAKFARQHDWIR